MKLRNLLPAAALVLAVLAAYANHFQNGFHFDDFHAVTGNPFIRDVSNIPRFFTDARLFSTMPDHASYRPVTSASLALDYRIGGGDPFWFHVSTFFWFAVLVVLLFFLFHRLMDLADPRPSNRWFALVAAAVYGLHPANAETVNYIVQRADLYATLGMVASLLWFIARPAHRRRGWYLLPAVIGFLAKPPVLIFAFILFYVVLFEQGGALTLARSLENRKRWRTAIRASMPAIVVTIAATVLTWALTPATFRAGAADAWLYRLTQPWVMLHYFKTFFLPTELSADTDWTYVAPFSTEAVAGYVFVAAMIAIAVRASRRRESRPVAFGILWFFTALVPTSMVPLAEVANDHRMFFAFAGLSLAVLWALRLAIMPAGAPTIAHRRLGRLVAAGLGIALVAEAAGTHTRNEVWRNEETLWQDVTVKSPHNGRGLMNYGLIFMARGQYGEALSYFERAQSYTPNYAVLEINLGIANGGLHRDAEAERHFLRARSLDPAFSDVYFYYGRWLSSVGRTGEAIAQLEKAIDVNRLAFDSRHLLLQLYAGQRNWPALDRLTAETLQLAPTDEVARGFAAARSQHAAEADRQQPTPESLVDLSNGYYKTGRFPECIAAARQAIALRPNYPEAYNNIAAAYISMGNWDEGIAAAQQAVHLRPDFQLAQNNLAWALSQKQKAQSSR